MANNRLVDISALALHSLPADWQAVLRLDNVVNKALDGIRNALAQRLQNKAVIFPSDPWRALRLTPLDNVRVVILGQDPYHGPGQAQGLAFSVPDQCPTPPSLRNIFKELDRSLPTSGLTQPRSNDLCHWAEQGVLLLNTTLTVEQGAPASHARIGWQVVTDAIISAVARRAQGTVFMLWGKHAQDKINLIQNAVRPDRSTAHLVLKANHPSPLSANRPPDPFIGCNHFAICQQWLKERGYPEIQW